MWESKSLESDEGFLRPGGKMSVSIIMCLFGERKQGLRVIHRFTAFVDSLSITQ